MSRSHAELELAVSDQLVPGGLSSVYDAPSGPTLEELQRWKSFDVHEIRGLPTMLVEAETPCTPTASVNPSFVSRSSVDISHTTLSGGSATSSWAVTERLIKQRAEAMQTAIKARQTEMKLKYSSVLLGDFTTFTVDRGPIGVTLWMDDDEHNAIVLTVLNPALRDRGVERGDYLFMVNEHVVLHAGMRHDAIVNLIRYLLHTKKQSVTLMFYKPAQRLAAEPKVRIHGDNPSKLTFREVQDLRSRRHAARAAKASTKLAGDESQDGADDMDADSISYSASDDMDDDWLETRLINPLPAPAPLFVYDAARGGDGCGVPPSRLKLGDVRSDSFSAHGALHASDRTDLSSHTSMPSILGMRDSMATAGSPRVLPYAAPHHFEFGMGADMEREIGGSVDGVTADFHSRRTQSSNIIKAQRMAYFSRMFSDKFFTHSTWPQQRHLDQLLSSQVFVYRIAVLKEALFEFVDECRTNHETIVDEYAERKKLEAKTKAAKRRRRKRAQMKKTRRDIERKAASGLTAAASSAAASRTPSHTALDVDASQLPPISLKIGSVATSTESVSVGDAADMQLLDEVYISDSSDSPIPDEVKRQIVAEATGTDADSDVDTPEPSLKRDTDETDKRKTDGEPSGLAAVAALADAIGFGEAMVADLNSVADGEGGGSASASSGSRSKSLKAAATVRQDLGLDGRGDPLERDNSSEVKSPRPTVVGSGEGAGSGGDGTLTEVQRIFKRDWDTLDVIFTAVNVNPELTNDLNLRLAAQKQRAVSAKKVLSLSVERKEVDVDEHEDDDDGSKLAPLFSSHGDLLFDAGTLHQSVGVSGFDNGLPLRANSFTADMLDFESELKDRSLTQRRQITRTSLKYPPGTDLFEAMNLLKPLTTDWGGVISRQKTEEIVKDMAQALNSGELMKKRVLRCGLNALYNGRKHIQNLVFLGGAAAADGTDAHMSTARAAAVAAAAAASSSSASALMTNFIDMPPAHAILRSLYLSMSEWLVGYLKLEGNLHSEKLLHLCKDYEPPRHTYFTIRNALMDEVADSRMHQTVLRMICLDVARLLLKFLHYLENMHNKEKIVVLDLHKVEKPWMSAYVWDIEMNCFDIDQCRVACFNVYTDVCAELVVDYHQSLEILKLAEQEALVSENRARLLGVMDGSGLVPGVVEDKGGAGQVHGSGTPTALTTGKQSKKEMRSGASTSASSASVSISAGSSSGSE